MTYRHLRTYFQKIVTEICEPFAASNRLISMKTADSVSRAYRATFGEYASKLDTLQRILESNESNGTDGRLETAVQDVEVARQAYHSARELLASELGVKSLRTAKAASR